MHPLTQTESSFIHAISSSAFELCSMLACQLYFFDVQHEFCPFFSVSIVSEVLDLPAPYEMLVFKNQTTRSGKNDTAKHLTCCEINKNKTLIDPMGSWASLIGFSD